MSNNRLVSNYIELRITWNNARAKSSKSNPILIHFYRLHFEDNVNIISMYIKLLSYINNNIRMTGNPKFKLWGFLIHSVAACGVHYMGYSQN